MILFGRDQKPHRNHRRFVEPVPPEKFLGLVLGAIGEQGDTQKIFLARELDRVVEQFRAVTVALILFMDDQIFQQHHETAFRGADGEK